jgi:hypothetical protein
MEHGEWYLFVSTLSSLLHEEGAIQYDPGGMGKPHCEYRTMRQAARCKHRLDLIIFFVVLERSIAATGRPPMGQSPTILKQQKSIQK